MSALAATTGDLSVLMAEMGRKGRAAAAVLATASTERKHSALIGAAQALEQHRGEILAANALDMEAGRARGMSVAFLDRLQLTGKR
ncbi:MAG: glutamate-5-semialdehyde dehydrogenase, partial [Devosia sp.]